MSQKNINDKYYRLFYQYEGEGQWMEKIWREAFRDEYPEGLRHYGYLTKSELQKILKLLSLNEQDVVLDIGCGKGGPGLKLAEETGAKLLGIDIIEEAIEQAKSFSTQFQLEQEALFHVGEFYNIPLDDEMVDAVVSFDSFWTVTDKLFALKEIGRVLKPGGRFVFTHWDLIDQDPIDLFKQSKMTFNSRHDSPGWKDSQRKVYEGIAQYEQELREEMGEGASMLHYEAKVSMPYLDASIRRIYCLVKT
ncbi:class I SAM-dependent methyltransferase [Portibacter marinus]|uniref:class I SAM-dependent methyltransferase n=1 Tax=Portibacter marinus TaxID=2898660 RepID=UPI001F19E596|nr:class I SAM-dependent methyltransferase [Portibacter marinus]